MEGMLRGCPRVAGVKSDSLRPRGLQHARPPYPSPSPRVSPKSCPLSRWCHPTISSSVVPFQVALVVNNPPANPRDAKRLGFDPWVGKTPWRRAWQPAPVFLSGDALMGDCPSGQWSLYSRHRLWAAGHKGSLWAPSWRRLGSQERRPSQVKGGSSLPVSSTPCPHPNWSSFTSKC